jgi:hypothetical protein
MRLDAGGSAELQRFVSLDVIKAVNDATTDLEILRPLANPAPSLQRPRAYAPPAGKLDLIQMPD